MVEPAKRQGPVTLIVGGDSSLGRALKTRCAAEARPFLATTRGPGEESEKQLLVDLASDLGDWCPPCAIDVAYIFAAVTSLAACEADPPGSYRINVENTVRIARSLLDSGAEVVFPSTNHVFDGTKPFRKPKERPCPDTEYGRQKAAAEEQLCALGEGLTVIRFSKIIGPNVALLRTWLGNLSAGRPIRPFKDAVMSPVPLDLAVEALWRLGLARYGGVFQLSATRDISYVEAAQHFARRLGVTSDLVLPTTAAAAGWQGQPFPEHTTLDASRLTKVLGLTRPDPLTALETVPLEVNAKSA